MLDHWGERCAVVGEARRWKRTPYHHYGNVHGAGVDCARILIEVYAAVGLIEQFDPPWYPPDWHMHRSEEIYLQTVQRFGAEISPADLGPGDIALFHHGRTFSHGAIVTGDPRAPEPTGWPWVVHAHIQAGMVTEVEATASSQLGVYDNGKPRLMRAFSIWVAR